ncbi:MAG: histidine--tRNA ligase, partial [Alkalibacterium sp.]
FDIKDLKLVINSLGDTDSRLKYREALIAYLEPHFDDLSKDSKERLYKNPLRVLDSKDKKDKAIVADAPSVLDFLNEESKEHFEAVKDMLKELGIPYEIDKNMVRGLDYYNDTIFEVMTTHPKFGSNATICAGGRYDGLVEEVGGPSTPAFGFGFGLERLLILLDFMDYDYPKTHVIDAYVVTIGDKVNKAATKLTQYLRQNELSVEREFMNRKPGKQFKTADKWNARYVFTLGEEELNQNRVTVKNLESGLQTELDLEALYSDFKETFRQAETQLQKKGE